MASIDPRIMTALKINRLPSLPHVLVEMLHACQSHQASYQDMSLIISRDASVTARVISLANSTFYSRGAKINTLERALLVLGTDTIKTLVITAAVQQFFSGFNSEHTRFLKLFWKRSLSCALIARSLAILTSYPNPEEAYLTGLLHNIGELVLDNNHPESFSEMTLKPLSEVDRLKEEQVLFSVNHAEVGAWLAKEWNLSDFTADAIEFHHAPSELVQDAHHLVKLIYLASHLSQDKSKRNPENDDISYRLFELNTALVNEIVIKIEAEVLDVAETMGIELDTFESDTSLSDNFPSDQRSQIELAQHIRNIGLIQTATGELNRANSKEELGRAFQSTLKLLFGYSDSAVCWYQSKDNSLSFRVPDQAESVPIKFKLEAKRSIVADAALENKIRCSLEEHESDQESILPVVDQQISHLVNAQGFICIPVKHADTLFCVLVVGCQHAFKSQSNQAILLKYFAEEISLACEDTLTHINVNENIVTSDELINRANEISHEANNPLNIITNYLSSLGQKLEDKQVEDKPSPDFLKTIQEELSIVREEVERTSQILSRLKDLKHDALEIESGVDINAEINNLTTLYKSSLFLIQDIKCELNLDPTVSRNAASRNQFKQILTNLLKNAAEAMPDGGTIKISSTAKVNVNGKDFVEINIADSGTGIPTDVLSHLFTPVTSTKGNGHSGLGLSITKNLVKDAKGTISCRSNENGTLFQILLPL